MVTNYTRYMEAGHSEPRVRSARRHDLFDLADARLAGVDAVLGEDRHYPGRKGGEPRRAPPPGKPPTLLAP
jgi:hypothetical protein